MIHIVCCTDENYAFNFVVIAQSILEHHAKEEVSFHLLHSALTHSTAEKIDQYVIEKGISFSRYLVDDSIFEPLPKIAYFTTGMYYRLLIPEMLPNEIRKVLYLDMDVLVEERLDEFWNLDLTGKGGAVIQDSIQKHLGEHSPDRYFNSGVMLMNLDYWREHNIKQKAVDFMQRHPDILRYPDQDALNVVLQHDVIFVADKWNYHMNLDKQFLKRALRGKIAKDKAPIIIHFNQKVKPWMYHCRHPYASRYWQLLKKTTFKDYKMKNKSPVNMLFYLTPKLFRPVLWRKRFILLPQN